MKKLLSCFLAIALSACSFAAYAYDTKEKWASENVKLVSLDAENNDVFEITKTHETITTHLSDSSSLLRSIPYNNLYVPNTAMSNGDSINNILLQISYSYTSSSDYTCYPYPYYNLYGGYTLLYSRFGQYYSALYDESTETIYDISPYYISEIRSDGTARLAEIKQTQYGVTDPEYSATYYDIVFKKFGGITVWLDGNMISFDQPPIIVNDRTLVPLRAIFQALDASVSWDEATETVTVNKGNTVISLTINNKTAKKNDETITLDVPAQIINDRTLVPVRFIADCFGVSTDWDDAMQKVILNSK